MSKFLGLFLILSFLQASTVLAFPLLETSQQVLIPQAFSESYDFEGIVALSNCSGSLVQFETSRDTDPALVLTNGHCYEGGMPKPGTIVAGKASHRALGLMNSQGKQVARVNAVMVLYATMTGTDMTLYRLQQTYGEIKAKTGIRALTLASRHPEIGTEMEVISGYWKRGYTCLVDSFVPQLREAGWVMVDSLRYSRPGCETIGGTSGSPITIKGTRTVIGVNNTGNDKGKLCTMNNPCEVDRNGKVTAQKGASYGQQTYWIYSCLNQNRELDLNLRGCLLPH